MPTANEILRSDRPSVIVFECWLDNTLSAPSDYYDWVGGLSSLGHKSGTQNLPSNAYVAISDGVVIGKTTNQAIIGNDFFIRRAIGEPFKAGAEGDLGQLSFDYKSDSRGLHLKDWQNKAFRISIGFADEDFSQYAVLITGKTIGSSMSNGQLKVSFTAIPQNTEQPFPTQTFQSGVSKGLAIPHIEGSVNKIQPVRVNDEGLYQFHDGTVATSATEHTYAPYCFYDKNKNYYKKQIETGNIQYLSEYIKITPSSVPSGGAISTVATLSVSDFESATGSASNKFSAKLADDSSLDKAYVKLNGQNVVLTKNLKTVANSNASGAGVTIETWRGGLSPFYPSVQNVNFSVEIHQFQSIKNTESSDIIRAYIDKDGQYFHLPTLRVANAQAVAEPIIPDLVLYDDNGYIKVNRQLTNFYIDANGSSASVRLNQAAINIASACELNLSSTITGPYIGRYYNEQKPVLSHLKELALNTDCFLDFDLAVDEIKLKRRHNHQYKDFDGNDTNYQTFSIVEDDVIGSVTRYSDEVTYSRYTISYDSDQANNNLSPTETDFNSSGSYKLVKRIDSPVKQQHEAQQLASLVDRDGAKKQKYGLTIKGAGHGFELSTAGTVTHPEARTGIYEIRSIKEFIKRKITQLELVNYG